MAAIRRSSSRLVGEDVGCSERDRFAHVLLDAQHARERDQATVVGKPADGVGAPAGFLVEALERVGAERRPALDDRDDARRRRTRPIREAFTRVGLA
jgi:hypothetical protein